MSVFNLLLDCPFTFVRNGTSASKLSTYKSGDVTVTELTRERVPDSEDVFVHKLKSSLVRHSCNKQLHLDDTLSLNRVMELQMFYGPRSDEWGPRNTLFRAIDKDSNGILRTLVGVCGRYNITLEIFLEFGTDEEDQMKVKSKNSTWIQPSGDPEVYGIGFYFDLNKTLAEKWVTGKFSGKLSIKLTLESKALNLVYLDNLKEPVATINRTLLADAASSGDARIVPKYGEKIRCHKAFLTVQSDVFKTMFKTANKERSRNTIKLDDMSEKAVRALLAYLYCRDIEMTLGYMGEIIALSLLKAADKYEIPSLHESMKDVILHTENKWFELETALQLWSFAKTKIKAEGESQQGSGSAGFKEIFDKALSVLKSKSRKELMQCWEFKEMLKSPETAGEMCISFLLDK